MSLKQDITQAGIHNIYLNNLLENGEIEHIKRGLYRWVDMENPAGSILLDVAMAIPNGVICLQYALAYYELTTYKPWEISVAIGRKSKVKLPEYPPVKLYYFSPKVFNAGIEIIQAGGFCNDSFALTSRQLIQRLFHPLRVSLYFCRQQFFLWFAWLTIGLHRAHPNYTGFAQVFL